MQTSLVLASTSSIRATLLENANIPFEMQPARVDEEAIRESLAAEGATPRDVADTLAEHKARKVGQKFPDALTLGCDQVAALSTEILTKPETPDHAREQILRLSGHTHQLLSAAVIYHEYQPIWRFVGVARLTMRTLSQTYVDAYVARNWDSIRHSVGGYKLEEEGVRLFSQIRGDYFTVLGLPLTELLSYLITRGDLEI